MAKWGSQFGGWRGKGLTGGSSPRRRDSGGGERRWWHGPGVEGAGSGVVEQRGARVELAEVVTGPKGGWW
jgi:hypothetical protein